MRGNQAFYWNKNYILTKEKSVMLLIIVLVSALVAAALTIFPGTIKYQEILTLLLIYVVLLYCIVSDAFVASTIWLIFAILKTFTNPELDIEIENLTNSSISSDNLTEE